MSTSAHDLTVSMDDRWREVEILVERALQEVPGESLYNALCRSATVLMVAHFEGFIKACVKAVIKDANEFSHFENLPKPLKRTYCSQLARAVDEKDGKHLNNRVAKLIEIFDNLGAKVEESSFLVRNEFDNDQNNPKPALIETICNNFGIERFFDRINDSALDIVFKDERGGIEELKRNLLDHLVESSKDYPYTVDSSLFKITLDSKPKNSSRTWQDFLDETLNQRHRIAHGTSVDNTTAPDEIIQTKNKLLILQYALLLILCENSTSKVELNNSVES